jgi:hypothetical protein
MEPQSQVKIWNEALGLKGNRGRLLQIHPGGYYELALEVNQKFHRALLPIPTTVLLSAEPLVETESIAVDRY